MGPQTLGSGRRIFAYRWGINPKRWRGNPPTPTKALEELIKSVLGGQQRFEIGNPSAKRTPPYGNKVRAGDILLFCAIKKLPTPGIYGVAFAGTRQQEARRALAVSRQTWQLPIRWLPHSKQLAKNPLTGHEDEFAPSGPGSTLLELRHPTRAIVDLVQKALRNPPSEPTKEPEPFEDLPDKERQWAIQQATRLLRDRRLRPLVLQVWGPRCAACGMSLRSPSGEDECEVAHIHPVADEGPDRVGNAVPLCRTHHWAYDQKIWSIRPANLKIYVRAALRAHPALKMLHGRSIPDPRGDSRGTAREVLNQKDLRSRWKDFVRAGR